MAGSAREEAERLVASFLARAAASSQNPSEGTEKAHADLLGLLAGAFSGGWSTGSAECCVCPVCKVIAAMRDPSPETAERLATSAGDIANGVAGLMRALSGVASERPRPPSPRAEARPADPSRKADPDRVWAAATDDAPEAGAAPDDDPWAAATAESAREAAREAAAAARARAAAAEEAVARAVEQARAAATATRESGQTGGKPQFGGDVWAMATAEPAAGDAAAPRSVDHDLGASAPEDRDAAPGDGARAGDAV
ncbi:hypothetical protein AB0M02_16605 [Actinoplanes sp. NPDC051861]|uniref:hypothetical protein n=1 Tax=Actinoplanes sp. NPDC051861 TaxID=3155170 RepID=UPI00342A969E